MMIPNLLVTDDDAAFRSVMAEALMARGFRVSQACDGQEAIELIEATVEDESRRVHLALVDVHMPRVDGLAVIRHLRNVPESPACVLMSALLDEKIEAEAVRMQAYRVLPKPVRVPQIRQVVADALAEIYGWQPSAEA